MERKKAEIFKRQAINGNVVIGGELLNIREEKFGKKKVELGGEVAEREEKIRARTSDLRYFSNFKTAKHIDYPHTPLRSSDLGFGRSNLISLGAKDNFTSDAPIIASSKRTRLHANV